MVRFANLTAKSAVFVAGHCGSYVQTWNTEGTMSTLSVLPDRVLAAKRRLLDKAKLVDQVWVQVQCLWQVSQAVFA
jgi:hypothetical protein